jgi:eukaryotic-like serine/threonine-protein kinase
VTEARWQRVTEVLYQALQLAPERRIQFLDETCGSDVALRAEIESLLAVNAGMSARFLVSPGLVDEPTDSRDLVATAGLQAGQVIAERFLLIRKLGEGGMGQVWLAEQTAPVRRPVALKLIRAGMYDEALARRFQAERQSLAIMDHPAIAKVFDAGATPQGQPYFVMEYVAGPAITEYCDQKKLSIRERLELFMLACDGVQHAHQKAIIHRDLKPANILIVEVDGRAAPRIIDFGLARAVSPELNEQTLYTRFGQFMGTPGYMSPEQVDPNIRDIDTRTDVYSLGVILYVLLTGLLPFESKRRQRPSLDEWLHQLREEEPPRPSGKIRTDRETAIATCEARSTEPRQLVSELRGDLDWITMKALERYRERRYATPAELGADLRRYLNHQPVAARPATPMYQIGKYVRRHRIAVGALLAVVSALATGLAVALWQAQAARASAREARAQELKVRRMGALSAEQAGDAASQLGLSSAAIARLAYAVRQDPENPALRSELLLLLEEQGVWWLPRGLPVHHQKMRLAEFSGDASRVATASEDGTARIWDSADGRPVGPALHHAAAVGVVRFSPDGTRVITGSADHTARVWDAVSGQPLGPPLTHGDEVHDGDFSHAGNLVVTASEDHTAQVWNWRTAQPIGAPMHHRAGIVTVRFSRDDARVVTGSLDHTARPWDAATGLPLGPALAHQGAVFDAEFSPDGRRIVTASEDGTARVWDTLTGRPIGAPMRHASVVSRAHFSADGSRVVTFSWDRTARIWDARTGLPLGEPMRQADPAVAADFSADGRRIFTAAMDGTVRAYDGQSAKPIGNPVRLSLEFQRARFSADGALLVTVSVDGTAQVWERHMSSALLAPLYRDSSVTFARFSPDGQRLVTNGASHTALIWDARTGEPLLPPLRHASDVLGAQFSRDGTKIMTFSKDGAPRLWNAMTGVAIGAPIRDDKAVFSAQFNPAGTLIFTAAIDGSVRLWDASSGEPHGGMLREGRSGMRPSWTLFSPDGSMIAATASNEAAHTWEVQIWDVLGGARVGAPMRHDAEVTTVEFSPDGRGIATASENIARLWDTRTGIPLGSPMVHGAPIARAVHFSPDGTRIVTGSEDHTARLWNARTGAPMGSPMTHDSTVLRAQFSPDGTRIATGSADETARLWDGRTGAPIGAAMRHDGNVWNAEFNADGTRVATASADRTARIWDAWTGRALSGPMRHDWPLHDAIISQDGSRILTVSLDLRRVRLWPVLSASSGEAPYLADLAEAVSGFRVDALNAVVPVPVEDRVQVLRALRSARGTRVHPPSDVDRFADELMGSGSAQ